MVACNILVRAASIWIRTARSGAGLMVAALGLGLARRMSKIMTLCTALALAGAVAGFGQSAAVRTASSQGGATGSWGKAVEVPGLAALNTGGQANVNSVSCPSAGNCAAGGYYNRRVYYQGGFLAVERHGRWGKAIEVPGLAALNTGRNAEVTSVSCASAGNCAAVGDYGGRPAPRMGSWSARRTASGARRSRCPAWAP